MNVISLPIEERGEVRPKSQQSCVVTVFYWHAFCVFCSAINTVFQFSCIALFSPGCIFNERLWYCIYERQHRGWGLACCIGYLWIIVPYPLTSTLPAREWEREPEPWAKLICLSGTVSNVFVCPFFSSRLCLTRKVEITNAWALCLGGLAKKENKVH